MASIGCALCVGTRVREMYLGASGGMGVGGWVEKDQDRFNSPWPARPPETTSTYLKQKSRGFETQW